MSSACQYFPVDFFLLFVRLATNYLCNSAPTLYILHFTLHGLMCLDNMNQQGLL
jgi:hypothetical protein